MKIKFQNSSLVFAQGRTYGPNLFDDYIEYTEGMLVYQKVDAVKGAFVYNNGSAGAGANTSQICSKVVEVHAGDKFVYTGSVGSTAPRVIFIYGVTDIADGTNMTTSGNTNTSTCVVLDLTSDNYAATNKEITITSELIAAAAAQVPSATKYVIRAWSQDYQTAVLKKIIEP